jgi:hypothetical protein
MPTLQNLVLTDRAGTPVDHTFTPGDRSNGVATVKKTDGTPMGDWKFSIALKKTATRRKASIRLVVPVVQTETINGIDRPTIVRTAYANLDVNFDISSTEQERDDLIGMLQSSLGESQTLVDGVVVGLDNVY